MKYITTKFFTMSTYTTMPNGKFKPFIAAVCTTLFLGLLSSVALAQNADEVADSALMQVLKQVDAERIKGHLYFLADDLLEGRLPGTMGYDIAAKYVETQFIGMGLEPAGVNGSYRQPVLLRKAESDAKETSFTIQNKEGLKQELILGKDFIMMRNLRSPKEELQVPVMFIGYGVHAPEIGYDDFAGVDVRGKAVALFHGLPNTIPDSLIDYYFAKKWDDIISRGAIAMIYLNRFDEHHDTWKVFNRMADAREPFSGWGWVSPDGELITEQPNFKIRAELTQNAAELLFTDAPVSFEEAFTSVKSGTPRSFELPVKVDLRQQTKHKQLFSDNVLAVLPGSDPVLKDEYVVYVAHLDHTGIGAPIEGDSINNGAQDNAAGTAIMLEVARTLKRMPAPKRSILFIGVTAEEGGLVGSDYFLAYPTVPEENIVAAFSIDMSFLLHPMKDVIARGSEFSSLIGPVEKAARQLDLEVSPDPEPEKQYFKASDQYSFAKRGIPALIIDAGFKTGDPAFDGKAIDSVWLETIYHTPLDNPDQAFDWDVAIKHVQINSLTGYYIANDPKRPVWNPESEYGSIKYGMK